MAAGAKVRLAERKSRIGNSRRVIESGNKTGELLAVSSGYFSLFKAGTRQRSLVPMYLPAREFNNDGRHWGENDEHYSSVITRRLSAERISISALKIESTIALANDREYVTVQGMASMIEKAAGRDNCGEQKEHAEEGSKNKGKNWYVSFTVIGRHCL